MKKKLFSLFSILAFLCIFWFAGPQLPEEKINKQLPDLIVDIDTLAQWVDQRESRTKLRPDNQARIVWANDSLRVKTRFSVLYLHGFSASWYEGYPVHVEFARMLGANLYLSRLAAHGLETSDPLIDMTPYRLYESAKEALLIAKELGNRVVVVGMSTGGTLALKLAADFPELVDALVLLSPNIEIYDAGASLLSGPWGLQIAKMIGGSGKYRYLDPGSETEQKYWYKTYRWEATVYLQQLIDMSMKPVTFAQVKQPLFLAYYYNNEKEQDKIVKVKAMLNMYGQLGTPSGLKFKVALPNAGRHEIACEETSKSIEELLERIDPFASLLLATL